MNAFGSLITNIARVLVFLLRISIADVSGDSDGGTMRTSARSKEL